MAESSDWRTPPWLLLTGKNPDLGRLCRNLEVVDKTTASSANAGDRATGPGNTVLRCTSPRQRGSILASACGKFCLSQIPMDFWFASDIRRFRKPRDGISIRSVGGNLVIPETKFHFEPPPGVAIVDESVLAGSLH